MFAKFLKSYFLIALLFWVSALLILSSHLTIFSLVCIAFVLGVRHGFDADHIVAIDNVTRKFAVERHYTLSTGTFFALGHSSIVFIMTILLICGITIFKDQSSAVMTSGAYIGSVASIVFLWIMALINLSFIIKLLKNNHSDQDHHFLSKLVKPLLSSVDRPYKMYFVGFVFGLGFDTATEIALLGLAASTYLQGESFLMILYLPLAFALGMALVDSLSAGIMAKLVSIANQSQKNYKVYQLFISSFALFISLLLGLFQFFNLFDISLNSFQWTVTSFISEYSEIVGGTIMLFILLVLIYLLIKNKYARLLNLRVINKIEYYK